ncbi:MAG TPA: hypothetical protein VMR06_07330 [Dokdonella sp.]|uniref:hypothetical protein n=1 Tax=Dokdonella sp. TaxID=2291710 RepID=UPI002C9CD7A8|nr:hypothetical protein [Dokdonella sp.]HUD41798.1 hypothetical protein [Dokdonella sp.]
MNKIPFAAALAALAAPSLVLAGQADICYSAATPSLPSPPPPDNTTVFHCPQAGSRTVPELAGLGWQIVQMSPVTTPGADPTFPDITVQLIVQKP